MLSHLTTKMQQWQDENNLVFRRLEASVGSISKSVGILSTILTDIQSDETNSARRFGSVEETLSKLTRELNRLESTLKDHMNGHIGVLNESLVGRNGFWRGIFLVVGFQATGWILYELYRSKKENAKKFL